MVEGPFIVFVHMVAQQNAAAVPFVKQENKQTAVCFKFEAGGM